MDLKAYQRDCLLGTLSGLLTLAGDLCLSVVPYTAGDSGLFAREAYLTGGFQSWRRGRTSAWTAVSWAAPIWTRRHPLPRSCRPGGRLIIPTYMNRTDKGTTNSVSGVIGRAGADFKRAFTLDTYRQFFADAGYPDGDYILCAGRIPCAVAVLRRG